MRRHEPIRPKYEKEPSGSGMEATIRKVAGHQLVHKVFHPGWIERHYPMKGRLRWITQLYRSIATVNAKEVDLTHHKRFGAKSFPHNDWEKMTFILANHSVEVLKAARALGIPTPRSFKAVCVKGEGKGYFWVVEMTDLKKPRTQIIPGDRFKEVNFNSMFGNYQKLLHAMDNYESRLAAKNIVYNNDQHKPGGAWIVQIDEKTGFGKLFLVDATNFFIKPDPKDKN